MIFEKEEYLVRKLESSKNNKIDVLKNELAERFKNLSLKEPEAQQLYINNHAANVHFLLLIKATIKNGTNLN